MTIDTHPFGQNINPLKPPHRHKGTVDAIRIDLFDTEFYVRATMGVIRMTMKKTGLKTQKDLAEALAEQDFEVYISYLLSLFADGGYDADKIEEKLDSLSMEEMDGTTRQLQKSLSDNPNISENDKKKLEILGKTSAESAKAALQQMT